MRTKIIAEIASSHNGDLELAKALIRAAAENGADIVKFQDWRASNVPETDPDKKRYERYQFQESWYPELIECCNKHGVEFLTSCFNADRVPFLAGLGLKRIKIASVCMSNSDLLDAASNHFDEMIVSTAMHDADDLMKLLHIFRGPLLTVLHCVANYPTTLENADLTRIDTLKDITRDTEIGVGYSDHALDLNVSKIALAKGIKYLEKHFTLSRHLPQIPHQMYKGGPLITTHEIAIEPHELKELATFRDLVDATHGYRLSASLEVEDRIKERYLNRYGK